MIKIDTEPSDELIDERIDKSDEIITIHIPKDYSSEQEAKVLSDHIGFYTENYNIVYIHYYPRDNDYDERIYTIGLKKKEGLKGIKFKN